MLDCHQFPKCREPSLRLLYIDDALIASVIRLDKEAVPLLPTLAPHGRMGSCQLGIPGPWFCLEHRLRDVNENAMAVGMKLNLEKKQYDYLQQ